MSVTGKTLGIVLIGLVGLLVYLALQIGSFAQIGIAGAVTYFGLFMTFTLLCIVMYLTSAPAPDAD
jgi:hypothetical protein